MYSYRIVICELWLETIHEPKKMTLSKHDRECFSVLCWYIVEQWKPIIVRKSGLSSTCKTSHLDSFGKWSDIMEIQQILCDRAEPWSQLQYLGTQVKVETWEPRNTQTNDISSPGYSHIIAKDREASWIRKHACEMSTYIESTGCGLNLRSFSPL
jgi:hypothetical protein